MSRYSGTNGAYPPGSDFAGLEYRRATSAQQRRAQRGSTRNRRERKLGKKLDELLGSVDDDYQPIEVEP